MDWDLLVKGTITLLQAGGYMTACLIHLFFSSLQPEKISEREGTLIIKKEDSSLRRENTVLKKKSSFIAQLEKQTSDASEKPVNKVEFLSGSFHTSCRPENKELEGQPFQGKFKGAAEGTNKRQLHVKE